VLAGRKMGNPAKCGTTKFGDHFALNPAEEGLGFFHGDAPKKMASGPHPQARFAN
jgi:hypothetical protein